MYGTIQVKLNVSDEVMAYLVHQCQHSNSLINSTVFEVRQSHFEECPRVEFFDANGFYRSEFKTKTVKAPYAQLCSVMKDNPHYKVLGGQCAQQTLKRVSESFASFNKLLQLFFKGEVDKPRMPNYRTKGGLAPISFPAQALQFDIETGECRIPVSQENSASVKDHFGLSELRINGAFGIKANQVVELRILPRNNEFYAEYVYQHGNDGATCHLGLDPTHALGIDPGLSNWLTCVSTRGKSFIVDGRKLKSINQNYNRRVAFLKTGKPAKHWDFELARITEKRNRQVRDAINKAARFVINHCLENRIGQVVFGWNEGNKGGINIGTKNNQEFVQIPTARLKNRIKQLCEENGIQFNETEESYTSKTSFLDDDFLPTYGEKPASWKPSGRRIKRGQYKTAQGILANADCNGAANILKKVSAQLGINLAESVRAVLTLPKRYDLFKGLKKSYRKRCEASLQSA
ncbi:transposase [Pseudanabaenaceae cyanobacterium LEGE 13415]|nr:transposase [Pseudanabaenaceae cyanobacterium LEGE 13415]